MVTKHNYQELIEYVNGLGFNVRPGFPGWIPASQKRMCDVANAIWEAGGKQFPIHVHYSRKKRGFTVINNHKSKWLDARRM